MELLFHHQITRIRSLVVGMDGVEVRCLDDVDLNAYVSRCLNGGMEQAFCFVVAHLLLNGPNGRLPFLGCNRVGVGLSGAT